MNDSTPHPAGRLRLRTICLCAVFAALALAAAGEEIRLLPVFRANSINGVGRILAYDIDGDGQRELVACANSGPFALARESDGTWRTAWNAPYGGSGTSIAAGDLDGDGGAEIVVGQSRELMVYDPRTIAGPAVTIDIPGYQDLSGVTIANVDADPALEIVAVTSAATHVYDGVTRELQWTAEGNGGSAVATGDIDGDTRREIVVNGPTGFVLDGAAEAQKWAYEGGFGAVFTLGNLDADAKDEIVFTSGSSVTTLHGDTFATTSWTQSDVRSLAVADADGNGSNEIILGSDNTNVTGRNPADGAVLWTIQNADDQMVSVNAADLNADGTPEVFWSKGGGIAVGTVAAAQASWVTPSYGSDHTSAFGDLDGDGAFEYVIGITRSGTAPAYAGAVQVFDGRTHALLRTLTPPSYVEEVEIGQLDSDPALEIAAVVGQYGQYLMVWDGVSGQLEFTSNGVSLEGVMLIENIDDDPVDEIIVATQEQRLVVFNGLSNVLQKSLPTDGYGSDFAIADLNGDGTKDLTVATFSSVTVYDTVSWDVLGSADVPFVFDVDATSAAGGTVVVSVGYSKPDNLRVFKGAALTPAYVCTTGDVDGVAFATIGGEERLIAENGKSDLRAYPLDGNACHVGLGSVPHRGDGVRLTALDVTGDGRQELIVDTIGATTVALLGLSIELRGDVNGDDVITAEDIDGVADYLSGAAPGIAPSADANSDHRLSPEDLFMLIDHEFAGGAAPQP